MGGKKVLREVTAKDVHDLVTAIRSFRVRANLSSSSYTADMNLNAGIEVAVDMIEKYFGVPVANVASDDKL